MILLGFSSPIAYHLYLLKYWGEGVGHSGKQILVGDEYYNIFGTFVTYQLFSMTLYGLYGPTEMKVAFER